MTRPDIPAPGALRRPQPIGLLPLPAGWLVLPDDALDAPAGADARDRLLSGHLPDPWPEGWATLRLAAEGSLSEAAATVDPQAGPQHAYNHFVLTGDPASLASARHGASGDLAVLVEVAAFALGESDTLPGGVGVPGLPRGVDGEVAAHLLAAHAAAALEAGDPQLALDTLVAAEEAARPVSPVLAALLLGQQAAVLQQVNGADPDVVAAYREAVDALRGLTATESSAGELALGLATSCHELAAAAGNSRELLVQAIQAYHLALRWLRKPAQPQRYAFAHSNLALAYLAMPVVEARDKLRRGVAVQSLREALKYYTRQEYPREWASITMNLANALQHLPTTHPVENLVEAVGIYEELLDVRSEDDDPLGYARVLANQGTALGHLGIHDQARAKLEQARALFARHGDGPSVATVDAALAGVGAAVGSAGVGSAGVGAALGSAGLGSAGLGSAGAGGGV